MDELESLKPEFQRQVDEFNKACIGMQQNQFNGRETTSYNSEASLGWPSAYALRLESKQVFNF